MTAPTMPTHPPCKLCQDRPGLGFEFSMAFQPIVDARSRQVYAYEALVRPLGGGSALEVLRQVNESNRYQFPESVTPIPTHPEHPHPR